MGHYYESNPPENQEDLTQDYVILSYFTSGKPPKLVSSERTPASAEVEATTIQSTSVIIVDTPMTDTEVCATVLTALTPAALSHFFVVSFNFTPPYSKVICRRSIDCPKEPA